MSAVPAGSLTIRPLGKEDISPAGEILYRAFNQVFAQHGYPPPILSQAAGVALVAAYHDYDPGCGVVAVKNGLVVGSAFHHRRGDRAGVGPVTVDPGSQGKGIGRMLMERVLDDLSDCASVRLFQDAFNHTSLALYSQLGFEVRDVMAVLRAEPGTLLPEGRESRRRKMSPASCRAMADADLTEVALCDRKLTGIDRQEDLQYLRERGPAMVLEQGGTITGYAVSFVMAGNLFLGPAAAPDPAGLRALVNASIAEAAARVITVRVPAGPGSILSDLLNAGFRIRTVGTYMVRGRYERLPGVNLAALFPEML